jgi:hypothetical protein
LTEESCDEFFEQGLKIHTFRHFVKKNEPYLHGDDLPHVRHQAVPLQRSQGEAAQGEIESKV